MTYQRLVLIPSLIVGITLIGLTATGQLSLSWFSVAGPQAARSLVTYTLADVDAEAVCLNGAGATVQAYNASSNPTKWIVMIGPDSPGLGFCINPADCAMLATPPTGPAPVPPPVPMYAGMSGPLSPNCTTNPDFCDANVAYISLTCSMDLLLGDNVLNQNGTMLHFKGQRVLLASLKKLASLGLAKAEQILLTGNGGHGGTMVFHLADQIGTILKGVAPSLTKYKAMPVDGFHPKMWQTLLEQAFPPGGRRGDTWYVDAVQQTVAMSKGAAALKPECVKANAGKEGLCLYVNNTLPFVTTPLFPIQQMNSVFDTQCINDGQPWGGILQITCSLENHEYALPYVCGQYTDLCPASVIEQWWVPAQKQYVSDFTKSGVHQKPGNGGFFHQCYLGSYINSDFASTDPVHVPRALDGIWNEVAVGGKTMQQAVGEWWHGDGSKPASFLQDEFWNPQGQPPAKAGAADSDVVTLQSARALRGEDRLGKTPVVPWYTNKFITNPTCRGFPWY